MTPAWDGLLLIDKPCGPTSHALVQRIRRLTGQRRIGHAGTLDPLASGLLPLVLGSATRLVRYLPHSPKTYTGTLVLGITTRTDDVSGDVLERASSPLPEPGAVLAAARRMLGRSMQVPPLVSARKVSGRRAYDLARRGVEFELRSSEIEVSRFEVRPTDASGSVYEFLVTVSAGTYVRALARDLGEQLGCGGALRTLHRTRIGVLDVRAAVRPAEEDPEGAIELVRSNLVPLAEMPLETSTVRLDDPVAAQRFSRGMAGPVPRPGPVEGACRVLDPAGRLLGIAEIVGSFLQPRVVLPAEPPPRPSAG